MTAYMDAALNQRGRASMDFLVHLSRGLQDISGRVQSDIEEIAPDPAQLPDDLDEREDVLGGALLKNSRAFRVQNLAGNWHSKYHGRIAREAFEEIQDKIEPRFDEFDNGPTTLEADETFAAPEYWDGVNFHRTEGGWDRHPHQGYIHGELIHRKMVEALFPGGIFKQRKMIAEMAPRESYNRVLDMGCSTGHFTLALAETYPNAEIVGVELSLPLLQHTRRIANSRGFAWRLYQRPAEATRFDEGSFDLAASYILLHELPEKIIRAVFAEAFRVLEPGGDMIMSDVTRYADLDKISEWKADRGARYGGEPYWRESASLDLGAVAIEAGFENVTAEGVYPHVVQGRKPA